MRRTRHPKQQMPKFLESATILEMKDAIASEIFYREKLCFRPGVFFSDPPTFCITSRAIEDQDYGCRDFNVREPDGHLIGIGQKLAKG